LSDAINAATRRAERGRTNEECAHTFLSGKHGLSMPSQEDRLQARTLDIANRLRFVCAHMPSDELLDLAGRMAYVELKYSGGLDPQVQQRRAANG
jgi:hypothetical protein